MRFVGVALFALLAFATAVHHDDFLFDDDKLQAADTDVTLDADTDVDVNADVDMDVDLDAEETSPSRRRGGNGGELTLEDRNNRCVLCTPGSENGGAVCGTDGRTYASLCALDLHNCRRPSHAPVRPACHTSCPCTAPVQRKHHLKKWRRPAPPPASHNHVLKDPPPPPPPAKAAEGSADCSLDEMADRLLDWFSVVRAESGGSEASSEVGGKFPRDCRPEVRWMFKHLDTDGDGLLSQHNLYALRHDTRERCLRPFLSRCAGGGGVTRAAWCGCMRRARRPCQALRRAHKEGGRGGWEPLCDARGWFRPRQCDTALGVCWCVDAHGAPLPRTRTRGRPHCPPTELSAQPTIPPLDESEETGAGAEQWTDDEDAPGSGDRPMSLY